MKQEYMTLRKQGLTPAEIAEKFHLSTSTVYKCLNEIAAANGVSREDLLMQPHAEPVRYKDRLKTAKPLDPSDFLDHFEKTMSEVSELHAIVKRQIKVQEKIANRAEEEEARWTR